MGRKKFEISNIFTVASEIEDLVERKSLSYMDACLHYCEINELEIEYVGELMKRNSKIKAMIEKEAGILHFLPKVNRLVFDE